MVTINTPYSALPPAQRLRKFQEQILNCKNELEKKQKAKYNISPKKKGIYLYLKSILEKV
jgi:hypothetical protein